jgi:hypothetical protein
MGRVGNGPTDAARWSPLIDSGEPGDTVQFAEYVERNLRLYQIRWVPSTTSTS